MATALSLKRERKISERLYCRIAMKEINVTNKNNYYQRFEVLKTNRNKRYKYNEFLVEGVRSLKEAIKND